MEDSLFTKIIKGEIPSHKVYEDDKTFAFLNIHPATEGHVLVIPKAQVEFVWDLEPSDYQALMQTVQKVGLRLREVIDMPYVGEMVVGVGVPHAHIHLIPFENPTDMKSELDPPTGEPNHEKLAEVAQKIRF